jgi:ribonuclease E
MERRSTRKRATKKQAAGQNRSAERKEVAGKKMIINVVAGEECRIAVLDEAGRLEELYMERASAESHVGNIYKARVTNVEPSIQAAFVDFGMSKNGFLHISDLHPQYFSSAKRDTEEVGRKTPRRERPLIQRCLRRGQEVIVQITKEGIGTKGPTLTTYLSLPGRYVVMMPGMDRLGVSRKIDDEESRKRMREVLGQLDLPKGMGLIVRTAGLDRSRRDLQRDLSYLTRLWQAVSKRASSEKTPAELYRESDLVIRTIRDVFDQSISKIIVDDKASCEKAREFLAIAMPRSRERIEEYQGSEPLFHKYGIEDEIEKIYSRQVPLPSGGSLVIDSTEALVAIDVNSGKSRQHDNAEESAYKTNLEASEEIARQLRLRDLGGVIICDFIDMRADRHQRAVERAVRDALKKHKERAQVLRMSRFGIIEVTRQRRGPALSQSVYHDCPHCKGSGLVKTSESMTLGVMRMLQLAAQRDNIQTVEVRVSADVAYQLLNRKRYDIHQLEQQTGKTIIVRADSHVGLDQAEFECLDAQRQPVKFLPVSPSDK